MDLGLFICEDYVKFLLVLVFRDIAKECLLYYHVTV